MWIRRTLAAALVIAAVFLTAAHAQDRYPVAVVDQVWHDDTRNRDIPVRLRLPQVHNGEKLPIIVFSHGLGGTRDAGERWAEHWASNGYFVIHVQHRGSDEELWKAVEDKISFLKNLSAAASSAQLIERTFDVRFVLDEATRHSEFAQADFSRIGMSGHAFGAYTAQALIGQKIIRRPGPQLVDTRIKAAVAFSPIVRNKVDAESQFEDVTVPFMSITGTLDGDSLGVQIAPEERVRPFYATPPGSKYLVVFKDGDHEVFSGRVLAAAANGHAQRSQDAIDNDARIARATQIVSLAFWDAYLKGNAAAERWLNGQARRVLGPRDRFEHR